MIAIVLSIKKYFKDKKKDKRHLKVFKMKIKIYLNYKDFEKLEELKEILNKIAQKDETFIFEFGDRYVLIDATNKDTAHKRGMWLTRKVDILKNHMYKIIS